MKQLAYTFTFSPYFCFFFLCSFFTCFYSLQICQINHHTNVSPRNISALRGRFTPIALIVALVSDPGVHEHDFVQFYQPHVYLVLVGT